MTFAAVTWYSQRAGEVRRSRHYAVGWSKMPASDQKRINLPRARTMRSALVAIVGTTVLLTLCASVRANWFNRSKEYLADCELEAQRRYYKSTSSHDVRRHIYLCMLAHGYAFTSSCDEAGWLDPGCYRLKYKTEGR